MKLMNGSPQKISKLGNPNMIAAFHFILLLIDKSTIVKLELATIFCYFVN